MPIFSPMEAITRPVVMIPITVNMISLIIWLQYAQFSITTECCNHCRSGWLYHESVNTQTGFVSYRCDSFESYKNGDCFGNEKQLMGEDVSTRFIIKYNLNLTHQVNNCIPRFSASGFYYLETNPSFPYAMG